MAGFLNDESGGIVWLNYLEITFYQHYGFYGKPDFMEFANRLGIVKKRAERLLLEFIDKKNNTLGLINQSFLSEDVKKRFIINYLEKVERLQIE